MGRPKKPPATVQAGFYEGHRIRTARVAGKCGNAWCKAEIKPGDRYIEGHGDGRVGTFSRERVCLKCGAEDQ